MIIKLDIRNDYEFYLNGVKVPTTDVVEADPEADWILLIGPKVKKTLGCVEAVNIGSGFVRRKRER